MDVRMYLFINLFCVVMIITSLIANIKNEKLDKATAICLEIYALIKTIECICYKLM